MKNIFLYISLCISVMAFSQKKDFDLPEANENYTKKKYVEAEANYRISKANNSKRAATSYNLGNAIYKQNQPGEAKFAYAKAIISAKGKQQKFQAYHNLGNALMKEKDYAKAVEAYKDALRNNPNDEKTRYNFALAKKMKKDNPEKKDDKKDKKDKDKDKKDKPKNDKKEKPKEGDDKKDDQGKPKEEKPKEQPKPQQGSANQERMKTLLDAVNNEEKKTQDKVNAKKVKGKPTENGKDW